MAQSLGHVQTMFKFGDDPMFECGRGQHFYFRHPAKNPAGQFFVPNQRVGLAAKKRKRRKTGGQQRDRPVEGTIPVQLGEGEFQPQFHDVFPSLFPRFLHLFTANVFKLFAEPYLVCPIRFALRGIRRPAPSQPCANARPIGVFRRFQSLLTN
jgi:hypothetical protein